MSRYDEDLKEINYPTHTKRSRLGLMEIIDATHCLYIAKGFTRCPTCNEDLTYE